MEKRTITLEEEKLYRLSSRMNCLIQTMEFVGCAIASSEDANMTFHFADSLSGIMRSLDNLLDGGPGW